MYIYKILHHGCLNAEYIYIYLSSLHLPSAWPRVASPFWFMLFFLRCFFLSVSGDEEPTSLVEEELDTPSTAESGHKNGRQKKKRLEITVSGTKFVCTN